jgi:hypothetical protein
MARQSLIYWESKISTYTKLALNSIAAICVWAGSAQVGVAGSSDEEALRRMKFLRDQILTLVSKDEAVTIRAVELRAPLKCASDDGPKETYFEYVGATSDPITNVPVVEINVCVHYMLQQLAEATVLGRLLGAGDSYFEGYMRYLAHWLHFGPRPLGAVAFAERYGIKNARERRQRYSESNEAEVGALEASFMSFFLAHELAHHVNNDISKVASIDLEYAADKWAYLQISKMGTAPGVIPAALLLNETERRSVAVELVGDHPAGIRRASAALNATLRYWLENTAEGEAWLKKSAPELSVATYLAAVRSLVSLVSARAKIEERLQSDSELLKTEAEKGNAWAQIRLSDYYMDGQHLDLPQDTKRALFWAEMAARNGKPFQYFDVAQANYQAGSWMLGRKASRFNEGSGDVEDACRYLVTAAKMGLTKARSELLVYSQICKSE